MSYNTIIYDLGNVLVRWDPKLVFNDEYFDSIEKRDYFLENICTADWNEEQDAGRSIVDGTLERIEKFPEWESAIRDYYGRWTEMLENSLTASVDLFRRLKKNKELKIYALTNWNANLFEVALVRYDYMHWFDGRVVSGEEKIRKPAPEFYQLLLDRYAVEPNRTIFIDDNERNIIAARKMGIHSIQFTNAEDLEKELNHLGVITR